MKTQEKYLDMVGNLTETGSDYAIAKLLGISRQRISNYRTGRNTFDDEMCTRIGLSLGKNPFEIIAAINAEKAKTSEKKKFWKDAAEKISATAAMLVLGTGLAASMVYSENVQALEFDNNIHYAQYIISVLLFFITYLVRQSRA